MSSPGSPASAPWWRRRRGAIDTAVALLVVPAVIGIGLAAGGAFDGDDSDDASPTNVQAEMQGPVLPGTTLSATPSAAPTPTSTTVPTTAAPTTPAPTTAVPTTAVPTAAPTPVPTTAAPTTAAPTTAPTTAAPTPVPTTAAPTPVPTTAAPATTPPRTAAPTPTATPKPTASPVAPRPPPVTTPSTPTTPGTAGVGKAPAPSAGSGLLVGKGQVSADLKAWQTQMSERGWTIEADGIFGSQTLRVLTSFQAEKGLSVDGVLGLDTWNAAWNAPVT